MLSSSSRIITRFASFLLMGLLIGAVRSNAGAEGTATMPPGAFLRSPVPDVAALNRELRADNLVVSRYSHLLRLSPAMVRATFAELHLTHLSKDMMLEVHYVHAGETIGAKVRRVRKGTAVFALSNGTPVLAQVCGNPLRAVGKATLQLCSRPKALGNAYRGAQMSKLAEAPDFDPMEPLAAASPATASHMMTMRDAAPAIELFPESKDELACDEIPADQMEIGEIIPPQTTGQAKSSLANWVGGGAILGLVAALGSPNVVEVLKANTLASARELLSPLPIVGTKSTSPQTVATPEPNSTMLATALGMTMLANIGLRRRKSRSKGL